MSLDKLEETKLFIMNAGNLGLLKNKLGKAFNPFMPGCPVTFSLINMKMKIINEIYLQIIGRGLFLSIY